MEVSILTCQHCSELVSHTLLNLFAKAGPVFRTRQGHTGVGRGEWIIIWSLLVLLVSYCREGELWKGVGGSPISAAEQAHHQAPVKFGRSTVGLRNLHF